MTVDNFLYGGLLNTEPISQFVLCPLSLRVETSDFFHESIVKLGVAVSSTEKTWIASSTLLVHITNVISAASFKEMSRVATQRVVTCVKHAITRHLSSEKKERYAMSLDGFPAKTELPITATSGKSASLPFPTIFGLTNRYLGPEANAILFKVVSTAELTSFVSLSESIHGSIITEKPQWLN